MRSRTIREGSVGLIILVGLAVFTGLVLWIRGLAIGNRSYKFIVNFANIAGMKVGASVRYRGVTVGKITQITPGTNGVDTTLEISPADLLIPRDVRIEANQAGFVGETSIDLTPRTTLPNNALSINPLSSDCNSNLVICDKDRLDGRVGVNFEELLRNTIRLSEVYTDPAFFNNVNTLTKNASNAATGVTQLTSELSLLSRSARRELGTFSTAANSVTNAANQTANQVGLAANRISNTADRLGNTAEGSAAQLNQLAASANDLLVTNRAGLVRTLDSVGQTSDQLRVLLTSLTPAVGQINSAVGKLNTTAGQINVGGLLQNLETLSANAAEASANLRDISSGLNSPENILLLQQTLDSARTTFENAQKITSDLDELTGDPAFRNNLRQLVNGLGNLVSSTEQLQQQVQVAQTLAPASDAINETASIAAAKPLANQQSLLKELQPAPPSTRQNKQKQSSELLLLPPAPKKPIPEETSEQQLIGEGESP
jgi:phospholipid/cholesterol/gamma-HCH transport system substrate-binding protein